MCTGHGVIGKPPHGRGIGELCWTCKGRGWVVHKFEIFTKRKIRDDLKKIELLDIRKLPAEKKIISYKKFLEVAAKKDAANSW